MYPLGHVGIAMASAIGLFAFLDRHGHEPKATRACNVCRTPGLARPGAKMDRVDFRFVIVGSMIGDMIDKVVGHVVLADTLDNGRLVGHTLLFSLAIVAVGLAIWASGAHDTSTDAWPGGWPDLHVNTIALGLASTAHLALDRMWLYPGTLLWPAMGWSFPAEDFQYGDWLTILATDPIVQAGEVVGGILLIAIALRYGLFRDGAMRRFLATGRLSRAG
ncbi:MAG: metal-dependent hydrolase [Thermoplasmata archaeon]|nr:metal-dependent hydrolase [Thermoplasmata archaeon]